MSVKCPTVAGIRQRVHRVMNAAGLLLVVVGAFIGGTWGGMLGGLVGVVIGAAGWWLVDKATQRYVFIDTGEDH